MKVLIIILFLTGLIYACGGRVKPNCHAQAVEELILPVYLAGTPAYKEHTRFSLICAGQCADGSYCDTIAENWTDDDGTHHRKVRCGCEGQLDTNCNIYISQSWHHLDSIRTILFCSGHYPCPTNADSCFSISHPLTPDTIRSRITGRDSIIIKKWVASCECM